MKLNKIIDELGLEILTGMDVTEKEVTGGYASDLLSDVMAHARAGNLWVTLQIHQNIVAVAVLKELTGIILVQGREPEQNTRDKALNENVCILRTPLSTFDTVGRLFSMGITGSS